MKKSLAIVLMVLVFVSPAMAGMNIVKSNGIMMTGADGVLMTGADGILLTGADGFLNANANGIMMTGADGIMMTGADGVLMTGADGVLMTGADGTAYPNSVRATSADGVLMTGADGVLMTGADGILMTGADGTTYHADSVTITLPNGLTFTRANGVLMTGADGVQQQGANGVLMTGADGVLMTGADGVLMTGADSVRATGADGVIFSVAPNGLSFTGVTGIMMTGADGVLMTGADGLVITGADGLVHTALTSPPTGLQSVDPEFALMLNRLTDDSSVNAAIVYHHLPTDADLADLQNIGVQGGTRYQVLPVITLTATRRQIRDISHLPSVRSIYGNRTLSFASEPEVRTVTGVNQTWRDTEVTSANHGQPITGKNVTVAVLDTGIDGTHGDLSGRVIRNVKLADSQSLGVGFRYPINAEGLPNTDTAYGHGTFVAGVIAGNGNQSAGKYSGVAPGARLVGLGAGDASLFYVLDGFDYLLANHTDLGVRVVNCSFSANSVFDTNDPVNIASKMLTDAGVSVVFSAGNAGPGAHTLNPYAAAPWVISVGATDTQGRLASFSSRGDFGNPLLRPSLVAPGVSIVSLRGSGVSNVTGAEGLIGPDSQRLGPTELPYYTTANGTSFSAPQVTGTIALMLEANPSLTPAQIKDILQRSATPLPPYAGYEVGTGMLNVHAAVIEAAFPDRRIGTWRGTVDRNQVDFTNNPPVQFSGIVQPGGSAETTVTIPEGTVTASMQISWGPLLSPNDLSVSVYDETGVLRGQSNAKNSPGLNGQHESVTLTTPTPGSYKIKVQNPNGGFLSAATAQKFFGVLEVTRATYVVLSDLTVLSPALQNDIYQGLRTFTIWPIGSRFGADLGVSRVELAAAMVRSGRVPQYLPGHSAYPDVKDAATTLFVESAQAGPGGALFIDVTNGGAFRPLDNVNRLAAAVALVRAAGLRSEAESKAGILLGYTDAMSIPSALRGYVSVAVNYGLLTADTAFRPTENLTRSELARATAIIQRRAVQPPT
ncbi:MAG TPA: S8 family serine peptidase [Pyrinomonadaceae bacterium]|nr:S8 family serine peptidase [Pyrinomonadaceae bacterium]